ncbi:Xaa-Pro aminopeptidase 1 [Vulcanimicrobium alpinum]|uniref:Xaa-Pro aminopeptidase n=1 Tax=Vulcanimicrobium alpinum TaxID=3016050 RepID=A0AAN2C9F9_UNVUL|nr:aminopeptidase P family protein [Vulcanimicrobium alpinum]BDE06254.1 Xaa-Pro aminopeptidase 1 [Vulcanimicrobium alpinum]
MSEEQARAAHDVGTPENLLKFMTSGWALPPATRAPKVEGIERFAARRDALSAAFPGETLIVPTGREKTRANDTAYRFRPGTDFYYLTGNTEPDNVLVLVPRGGTHDALLYCEPNPGKTDATFFTDRVKGELWVGPRLGLPQTEQRFGIAAKPLAELAGDLADVPAQQRRSLRGIDPELDATLAVDGDGERDGAFATFLSELRLIKDDLEVRELRRAIAATQRGFDDVVRALPSAKTERYVEGVFNFRARVDGNDVGYNTIAASGANACTLHWTRNDRTIGDDELLLLDAGVEAETLYTADITRTVPIGGRFTPEQRTIYQLVYDAQQAAFAKCAPGNDFLEPNRAAMHVLAHGLERLGILPSAEDALRDENLFYKRYSLHNVSHMLGLDVHDCAAARAETYKFGALRAGMVLTVEPGLYFQPDDLTVPAKYRGIGVRIEDDVLITESGVDILSAAIPSAPDAVEAWVQSARESAASSR